MTLFWVILACLFVALIIWLLRMKSPYEIRRSTQINADINTVFKKLCDFKSWPDWSPWLMHEPGCKLAYSDNCSDEGGYYQWDGQYIGAGKLTHIKLDRPNQIRQKIEFTRPFKSTCQVGFSLRTIGNKTKVTWSMQGAMPFLLRSMIKKLKYSVGQDYKLGLAMLAGQLDPAAEYPVISFSGESALGDRLVLCRHFSGTISEMSDTMQNSFPALIDHAKKQDNTLAGRPFTVYHNIDTRHKIFECDLAVPVTKEIDPGPFELKNLAGNRYFRVNLKGSYGFLEGAWYSAYAHLQMLKIRYDKQHPALEIYENDPETLDTQNDLLTSIYIPLK